MDTAMVLTVYGEDASRAANAAEEEIYRLDSLLSRTNEASKVSLLNSAEGKMVPVGVEICDLIQKAGTYTDLTGGAFDITIAPVVSAWGFTTDHYQVPAQEELEELLTYVGMEHVHLFGKSSASSGYENASLDPGTQIDLGVSPRAMPPTALQIFSGSMRSPGPWSLWEAMCWPGAARPTALPGVWAFRTPLRLPIRMPMWASSS